MENVQRVRGGQVVVCQQLRMQEIGPNTLSTTGILLLTLTAIFSRGHIWCKGHLLHQSPGSQVSTATKYYIFQVAVYTKGESSCKVVEQSSLGKDPKCEETHRANCLLNSYAKVTFVIRLRLVLPHYHSVQVSQYELPIQAEVALSKANRPPRKTISQVLLSAHTPTNAKSHTIHGDSAANF